MSNSKHGPKNLPMDEIIDRYVNGMEFITTLAKDYEVTYTTMKNRLVKSGVKIRDKKEEKKRAMNREETKERVSEGSKRSADKRKQTNLEKYGHETAMCAPEIKEKWQKEHEEKYGVKYGTQRKDTIEKRKQTLLEQYGVDNVSKIPGVAQKISENRWQNKSEEELVEIISKMQDLSPESKERHREGIKRNRWENKSEEELKEIWDKTLNTWLENYGYDNPNKRPEMREHLKKVKLQRYVQYEIPKLLDYWELDLLDDEFLSAREYYNWKCRNCGKEFEQKWNEVQQGYMCPNCYPRNKPTKISKGERELTEFLRNDVGITNLVNNTTKIIPPKEIDIHLPDYNLGIEFDGIYWHSEENNHGSKYHIEKTKECEEKGIRLIHIFEDEWVLKKDVVKSRILQILGFTNRRTKINARDCNIAEIDSNTRDEFLHNHHLQGTDNVSTIRLGAYHNGNLVSVMTFSSGREFRGIERNNQIFELSRFCIHHYYHIPGIADKLLSYFKNNYEWKKIITYCDKRWSNGNLYNRLKFEYISDTDPSYWFIIGGKRMHRMIELKENMNKEKEINRIWDCGHMKFELNNDLT